MQNEEKYTTTINYSREFCPPQVSCSTCRSAGTCDWRGEEKLSVFDIFADIPSADAGKPFPFVEVRFKNTRKEFFHTGDRLYQVGQAVVVEGVSGGYDLGIVSAAGDTARWQLRDRGINPDEENMRKVYRLATQRDLDTWHRYRAKEEETKLKARKIASDLGLVMKISDVEYQADGGKVTFYYTAEERVDFRELIKILAKEFSTRIEMRQIGYRQEAARLGGIGSCGRELCCSTWMTDFRSVTTQTAKYQQLALNPSKLTGQCGKLKCCLNFELDSYKDALKEFPDENLILNTEKGEAKSVKVDVFKGLVWYAYTEGDDHLWYKLSLEQVQEIISLNEDNQKAPALEFYADELKLDKALETPQTEIVGDVLNDRIDRFDEKKKRRRNKRNKRKKNNNGSRNPSAKITKTAKNNGKKSKSQSRKR